MTAKELFEAGKLSAAIEAVTQDVKSRPSDASARTFLFELLSFAGQWDRATKQLEAIAHLDSNVQNEWATQVYLNLLHAEGLRKGVFTAGKRPEFLLDPPPYVDLHLQALAKLNENRAADAQTLLDESHAARGTISGRRGEVAIDEFCDCDDVLSPILELVLIRDYIWLPLSQVTRLEVAKPERPRDLIWVPVRVDLVDGTHRRCYMPARYFGSTESPDEEIRLSRATDWQAYGGDGPVRGVGVRQFLVGEDAAALFELGEVTLDQPAAGA